MRLSIGSIVAFSVLAACSTPSPPPEKVVTDVRQDLQRLGQMVSETPIANPLTGSCREALEGYLDTLQQYRRHVSEAGKPEAISTVADLRAALAAGERLQLHLTEKAQLLAMIRDAAEEKHHALLDSESPEEAARVETSAELVEIARRAAATASSSNEEVVDVHRKLRSDPAASSALRIFHFLRLRDLGEPQIELNSKDFEAAWKTWVSAQVETERLAAATDVVLFVAQSTGAFPTDGMSVIRGIFDASLDDAVDAGRIEELENAIGAVRSVVPTLDERPADWEAALDELHGVLLAARARVAPDDHTKISLAVKARQLAPRLEEMLVDLIVATGRNRGEAFLKSGRYKAAMKAFEQTIAQGRIPEQVRLAAEYRATVFERGLKHLENTIGRSRFDSAKRIAARLEPFTSTVEDERRLRDALYSSYELEISEALKHGTKTTIEVCEELVDRFPDDLEAKRKLDTIRLTALRRSLGDPQSSDKRLGGRRVAQLLRETEATLTTSEGKTSCENLLTEIDEAWTARLATATTVVDVTTLATGLAELRGEGPTEKRRALAAALSDFVVRAAADGSWGEVETCLKERPGVPDEDRPSTYRKVYREFLDHLDAVGDLERLARHAEVFAQRYPESTGDLRELVAKHAAGDNPQVHRFGALLKEIDPEAAAVPTGVSATVVRVAPREPERRSSGVWFHVAGCSIVTVVVCLLTWRRGLLPFQWYILAALWVGIALGSALVPTSTRDHELSFHDGQGSHAWRNPRAH